MVAAAANLFGLVMLFVAGIGGTIGAFLSHGFSAAVVFLLLYSIFGAAIVSFAFGIFAAVIAAIAYGIVWVVHPSGWPVWLRWILVAPAAGIGFILATILNVAFRLIELWFPLQGATAIMSEFFVSFAQTALAVTAAAWIAPTGKQTVSIIFATAFSLLALLFLWPSAVGTAPTDTPRWANVFACVLSAAGAIMVPIATARTSRNAS